MTLDEFQALKDWHARHAFDRPLEGHVWDGVMTLWLIGWVGTPTAWIVGAELVALCTAGCVLLPGVYVALRRRLHRSGRLRCDWLRAVGD